VSNFFSGLSHTMHILLRFFDLCICHPHVILFCLLVQSSNHFLVEVPSMLHDKVEVPWNAAGTVKQDRE
jgi:hypothetical protein